MTKFAVACAVLGLFAGVSSGEDLRQEFQTLQGDWTLVSQITSKFRITDARALKEGLRISGSDWVQMTEGREGLRQKIALGIARSPKAIDLTSTVALDEFVETEVVRGIYRLEGDTLTVATSRVNSPNRPEKFEAGNGTNTVLSVYKRNRK